MINQSNLAQAKTVLTNLGFPKFFSILNKRKKAIIDLKKLNDETTTIASYIDFESSAVKNITSDIEFQLGNPFITIELEGADKELTKSSVRGSIVKAVSKLQGYHSLTTSAIDNYIDYDKVIYDTFTSGLFDIVGVVTGSMFKTTLDVFVLPNKTSLPLKPDLNWFISEYENYLSYEPKDSSDAHGYKVDQVQFNKEYALLQQWVDNAYDLDALQKGDIELYTKINACKSVATILSQLK